MQNKKCSAYKRKNRRKDYMFLCVVFHLVATKEVLKGYFKEMEQ
jgi:hypothetical protein